MSGLNVALIVRLLDQVTAPAQKVRNALRVIGNETKGFRRDLGKAFKSDFSSDNIAKAIERNESRISKARGRLMGAAGMAVTLAAPVIIAGNFQERMIDFGILADQSAEQLEELDRKLDLVRKKTGKGKGELLDGMFSYVGKGLGVEEALASLEATGTASVATKAAMDEMANSGFSIMDNLNVTPDLLKKAFDIMATSGKEGSFELSAMARKFPEITAGAKALKMEGVSSVASLAAALQVAMKSAGSEDQAATNLTNFMGKITAPDTVKKFKEMGVNIEKEMKIAAERGVDPLEHMLLVIKEMTGGDAFKMGELFADKQVLDFLRAAIPNLEEYQRIRDKAMSADGTLDKDAQRVLEGFNAQWKLLRDSVTSMLGPSGALLPILTDIMIQARGVVEGISAWTAANPELTAMLIKGAAALLAFGVATRVLGYGFAIMQGGLIRTAALFLKFNSAGKNVSVVSRAFRAASWSAGMLFRSGTGLARLMSKPLRWSISALKWSRLIPKLRWAAFLPPKLALRTLVHPLKWTSRLIPMFKWAAFLPRKLLMSSLIIPLAWTSNLLPAFASPLARFASFRTSASSEITGLSRHVATQSGVMKRSLSGVRWSAVGVGIAMFAAMNDAVVKLPEDPTEKAKIVADGLRRRASRERELEDKLFNVPVLGHAMRGINSASEYLRGKPNQRAGEADLEIADRIEADVAKSPSGKIESASPSAAEKQEYIDELSGEIADLTAQIAAIKDGPLADTLRRPLEDERGRLKEELALTVTAPTPAQVPVVQAASAPVTPVTPVPPSRSPLRPLPVTVDLSAAVTSALKPIARSPDGPRQVTPRVSDRPVAAPRLPAIDGALAKAVSDALSPLANTVKSSMRPVDRPTPPVPAEYKAPQPHVDVASTFQANTSVAVDVKVSMPITINREQRINNAAIAKEAGRKAGADTERAIRRGLDDGAIAE